MALSEPLRDVMRNKHRFVVIDSETFKEKLSFQLTGINLIVSVGAVVIVLIVVTNVLIIFTPLRQLIPGYINNDMVEQTYRNARTVDSLERELRRQEWFIVNMQEAVSGKSMPSVDEVRRRADSLAASGLSADVYVRSADDSLLRAEMEQARRGQRQDVPSAQRERR
ncbi:MAG: metalloendopeptidase-like membrane protein [bacterium P3]|nr:MAG: metalloendopeptidase-like membrane protein [bacterium P3]KWW41050.1 MAG: metalloendopeptidase-like membrane protein [bacterium F083]